MHIKEFSIDGFGIFSDCLVQDLPAGLIVVAGNNECGKSTLMQFFRMILFGPNRGKSNPYLPLAGGQHGGRIRFVMKDGREILVERVGKKITIVDSEKTLNNEASEYLLNHLDRQTFERVFAMGLDDLQGFDILTEENAQARLMAAGAGLGAASVPETLKKLNKKIEELLKPGGRAQKIPKLKKQLNLVQSEINSLRQSSSRYAEVEKERVSLKKNLAEMQSKREQLFLRRERLRKLEDMRDAWVRLHHNLDQIEQFVHAKAFPAGGEETLKALKETILELEASRQKGEQEEQSLVTQLEQLDRQPLLTEHHLEIEGLVAEREKYSTALEEKQQQAYETEQANSNFKKRLNELGPHWTEERMLKADTSVQTRQIVQKYIKEINTQSQLSTAAENDYRIATDQMEDADSERELKDQALQQIATPEITDPDELKKQRKLLRVAQETLRRILSLETANETKEDMLLAYETQIRRTDPSDSTPISVVPRWISIGTLAFGFLSGGTLYFMANTDSTSTLWKAVGIFLIAIGAITPLIFAWLNAIVRQQGETFKNTRGAENKKAIETLQSTQRAIEQNKAELEELRSRLRSAAGTLSLTDEQGVDPEYLSRLDSLLEETQEHQRLWLAGKRESKVATDLFNKRKNLQQRAKEKLEEQLELSNKKQSQWESWLGARGFDQDVLPEQFEVVLKAIEAARIAKDQSKTQVGRLDTLETYISETGTRLLGLCQQLNFPSENRHANAETIDILQTRLTRATAVEAQYNNLTQQISASQKNLRQIETQLTEKRREYRQLLEDAGSSDELEFASKSQSHLNWKNLDRQISEDRLQLSTTAGGSEILEEMERELSNQSPEEITLERDATAQELQNIIDTISQSERRVGELDKTLKDMAINEALSHKLLEQNSLTEQIHRASLDWAKLAVYRSLLQKARDVHERDRQPQVIQAADRYLSIMVDDRYKLVSSMDEDTIQLEAKDLKRKTEGHWSSGLSDQTYLATRLGMATQFGQQSEPLPLILDDVLVRFDPDRRRAAMHALLKAAEEQQIFLFSCHPEVIDDLNQIQSSPLSPAVPVRSFSISNGKLSKI